jgi:hypothetical protein
MEVYIEQQLPDNCVTLKVSVKGSGGVGVGRSKALMSVGPLVCMLGIPNTDC